ncbi:hypothetical protein RFF05_12820 [Bengtsoniella intestinalis]|uniref:glycosyl-4,4'-diaponeurosporenoate acyltransferase CrtO family protein n=1 Tax=Bengtsoniella intestinalis TaxID=3073143 RepID=UPI00391EEE96
MKRSTMLSLELTVLAVALYYLGGQWWLKTVAIATGTTCYHFAMRLAVGTWYQWKFANQMDYHHGWFAPKSWEKPLYDRLQVKRWKRHLPTYDPAVFDVKQHSYQEIVMAMCQSELVHETIIILSFLPIFVSYFFGARGVFLVTSILATMVDLSFVVMQRYNRPRMEHLMARMKKY